MDQDLHKHLSLLQQPIQSKQLLLALLATPLAALGLLPPQFHALADAPLPPAAVDKHVEQLQRAVLLSVAPAWEPELAPPEDVLLTQYFVPDPFTNARPAAGRVARSALALLLSAPPTPFALTLLARLAVQYPVDRCFRSVFTDAALPHALAARNWSDCVRDLCAVPDRVANALAARARTDTPPELTPAAYYSALITRTEILLHSLSAPAPLPHHLAALAELLSKLAHIGLFPPSPPSSPSQPSFFSLALPSIRAHLDQPPYAALWPRLLRALPSALTLQTVISSLLGSIPALVLSPPLRAPVRSEAAVLRAIVGPLRPGGDDSQVWDVATALILSRDWKEWHARLFVAWICPDDDVLASEPFFDAVLSLWSSPIHIKHSLLPKHRYTTLLLLLALYHLPKNSPTPTTLTSHPAFVRGISAYISHLDPAVRRCGMLTAELAAHRAGRELDFKDWDGAGDGREWAREVRSLVQNNSDGAAEEEEEPAKMDTFTDSVPAPQPPRAEFIASADDDSDDSLTGYASSSASSRSPSPTPSSLAEIEHDPTLSLNSARPARPVYLLQLSALLRGTTNVGGPRGMGTGTGAADDPHEADRIAVGLESAEALIRRKRAYGTELDECAVDLTCALLGMNDNYNLDGFPERRQGALIALVACAPTKAAPTLIQELYKNQYSVEQRFVALNALALGARELAGLPVPPSAVPPARTAFPSKTLPAPLHARYIRDADVAATADGAKRVDAALVPKMVDGLARLALDKNKDRAATADAAAPIIRERRLRVTPARAAAGSGITELAAPSSGAALNPYSSLTSPSPSFPNSSSHTPPPFSALAAPYFVVPLIHGFWAHLQAAHAREARTASLPGRARFHGAGTGLVLSPLVLAQLVRTLAVLVNAGLRASEWLAAVAPAALELAVAVGTQRVGQGDDGSDSEGEGEGENVHGMPDTSTKESKQASLLAAALELTLVTLDGALELDGGRVIALEHTAVLLGAGEWAGAVLARVERGMRVPGGGGAHAERVSRAAAGVLLKLDEITERWKRSMLDLR